ncbi:MAG: prenyltransferase [Paludibacteraceae bacterium]|nr:prenyltransferase [Paludibacteraceae bacterium]MBN2786879.1 prenyltransferase [Paludibacteraceae bacterium]
MTVSIKNWLIATRPWSFPASSMPALVAISYAYFLQSETAIEVNWLFGILAMVGAVIFQASGNLIGDYFDYKYRVDRKESFGSSRLLVDEVFSPRKIFVFGIVLLIIGSFIGLFLLSKTGLPLLWIGLIGVLSTYFYYKLKYIALGDAIIFVIYGQLIGLGTFFVMTNRVDYSVLLLSAPVGFLVVNILHANNTRDIKHDGMANIKTQAMVIGLKASKMQYSILGFAAYVGVIFMVTLSMLHPISLIVLLTLPLFLKNNKQMQTATIDTPENIKELDGESAKLVMVFSVLLAVSNFLAGLF